MLVYLIFVWRGKNYYSITKIEQIEKDMHYMSMQWKTS